MQQQSYRVERVNERIHRELVLLLKNKIKDPELKNIAITEVLASRDLSHAKVFYSTTEKDKAQVEKHLNKASGFLRTYLSKSLTLRHTPALRFVFDPAPNTGARIEQLLAKL